MAAAAAPQLGPTSDAGQRAAPCRQPALLPASQSACRAAAGSATAAARPSPFRPQMPTPLQAPRMPWAAPPQRPCAPRRGTRTPTPARIGESVGGGRLGCIRAAGRDRTTPAVPALGSQPAPCCRPARLPCVPPPPAQHGAGAGGHRPGEGQGGCRVRVEPALLMVEVGAVSGSSWLAGPGRLRAAPAPASWLAPWRPALAAAAPAAHACQGKYWLPAAACSECVTNMRGLNPVF